VRADRGGDAGGKGGREERGGRDERVVRDFGGKGGRDRNFGKGVRDFGGKGGREERGGKGGGKGGKGGRDNRPVKASDLDNDLDSYMTGGSGGGAGGAAAAAGGGGGKKGKGGGRAGTQVYGGIFWGVVHTQAEHQDVSIGAESGQKPGGCMRGSIGSPRAEASHVAVSGHLLLSNCRGAHHPAPFFITFVLGVGNCPMMISLPLRNT